MSWSGPIGRGVKYNMAFITGLSWLNDRQSLSVETLFSYTILRIAIWAKKEGEKSLQRHSACATSRLGLSE